MAIMTDAQRRGVWTQVMQEVSNDRESISITKADLRAVIDATDQWISDNAASFNSALPQPGRSALTAAQKSRIYKLVLTARYGNGV